MCLAVPGKVMSISGEGLQKQAKVSFAGVVRDVNLAFTPLAKPGDFVIVHVGFAISLLDPEAAARTLDLIDTLTD